MDNETNNLDVWQDDAPIISLSSNLDFDVWQDDAPVLDIAGEQVVPPAPIQGAVSFRITPIHNGPGLQISSIFNGLGIKVN